MFTQLADVRGVIQRLRRLSACSSSKAAATCCKGRRPLTAKSKPSAARWHPQFRGRSRGSRRSPTPLVCRKSSCCIPCGWVVVTIRRPVQKTCSRVRRWPDAERTTPPRADDSHPTCRLHRKAPHGLREHDPSRWAGGIRHAAATPRGRYGSTSRAGPAACALDGQPGLKVAVRRGLLAA